MLMVTSVAFAVTAATILPASAGTAVPAVAEAVSGLRFASS